MNFTAIDVETANANMASICQIGLAKYVSGHLAHEWKTYVDPEDYFDGMNVAIHGIDESTVEGAPTFPELNDTLRSYLENSLVKKETPQLCWGGRRSLTIPDVP
jgi:DNA polymerase-3 subunit epsilon